MDFTGSPIKANSPQYTFAINAQNALSQCGGAPLLLMWGSVIAQVVNVHARHSMVCFEMRTAAGVEFCLYGEVDSPLVQEFKTRIGM